MTNSRTTNIDGVGPVLFEHSRRAKHVSISVKPFKGVRVAVPIDVSFRKAEEFVHAKARWIKRHLVKMKYYENQRETIWDNFTDIDRAKAKIELTRRLKHLAEKHGFTFSKVSIRNQRTRWGSCSHKNNISLNMKLVRLPDDLVDYVIIHELVHTRKKNHGKGFWAMLDKCVGNGKDFASRLRKYGVGLP
jgi:predicted metal-dependent hydrolase